MRQDDRVPRRVSRRRFRIGDSVEVSSQSGGPAIRGTVTHLRDYFAAQGHAYGVTPEDGSWEIAAWESTMRLAQGHRFRLHDHVRQLGTKREGWVVMIADNAQVMVKFVDGRSQMVRERSLRKVTGRLKGEALERFLDG